MSQIGLSPSPDDFFTSTTSENAKQVNLGVNLTGEVQALPSSTLRCHLRLAGHGTAAQVFYEIWGFVTGVHADDLRGKPPDELDQVAL